jgi:glutathione S-transferase fosA5
MPGVTGLNHINLSITDLERSFAFYVGVLGFRPLARWARGAYLLAGSTWICLSKHTDVPGRRPDYTHVAFTVAAGDFDALRSRIEAAGAARWQPNTSEGASFYFLDPDGHQLEIHVGDWQSRLADPGTSTWDGFESFV